MWSWIWIVGVVLLCQSGLFAGFNSIGDIMGLFGG